MGVETISEFEKCEFMNMLEFIRRTEIHITISVDKITTILTGPTLTWEYFISHGVRLFKTTLTSCRGTSRASNGKGQLPNKANLDERIARGIT